MDTEIDQDDPRWKFFAFFFREFLVLGDVRACHKADTRASLNPLARIVDDAIFPSKSPLFPSHQDLGVIVCLPTGRSIGVTSTVRITTGTKRQGSRPGMFLRLDLTAVMPIPGDAREVGIYKSYKSYKSHTHTRVCVCIYIYTHISYTYILCIYIYISHLT